MPDDSDERFWLVLSAHHHAFAVHPASCAAARLGVSGEMITEYPLEHRRYDQSEYEPFWAAAAALDLPLSLHTAT
jgi:predicted TIM-barrel fold metal-dependent hydrolase